MWIPPSLTNEQVAMMVGVPAFLGGCVFVWTMDRILTTIEMMVCRPPARPEIVRGPGGRFRKA